MARVVIGVLLALPQLSAAKYAYVNFIRHGEKSPTSGPDLTPDGQHRAQYLAKCMSSSSPSAALPYGAPVNLLAAKPTAKSNRPYNTLLPLSETLGLKLHHGCKDSDTSCLAEQVAKLQKGDTLVVAWEHKAIPALLATLNVLGGSAYGSWPDSCPSASWEEPSYETGSTCYDAIWQVKMDVSSGTPTAVSIQTLHEGFGGSADSPCAQDLAPEAAVAVATDFVTSTSGTAILNIFRHGEKSPTSGTGLTVDGEHRAQYIARCMSAAQPSVADPHGKPTVVMAPIVKPGKSTRPRDTVAPLAAALGLPLVSACKKSNADCFVNAVSQHLTVGGTMAVAWEHNSIPPLIAALNVPGADDYSSWPDSCPSASWPEPSYETGSTCYDIIWQVTMSYSGGSWSAVSIRTLHEGFGGSADSPCAQDLAPTEAASSGLVVV